MQIVRSSPLRLAAGAVHFVLPAEGQVGVAYVSHTRDVGRGGLTIGGGAAYTTGWDTHDAWAIGGPLILLGGDFQLDHRTAVGSIAGGGPMLNLAWRFE